MKKYLSHILYLLSQLNLVDDLMLYIKHNENKAEFTFKVERKDVHGDKTICPKQLEKF